MNTRWIHREDKDRWLLVLLSGFTLFYVLFVFRGYGIQTGFSYSGHSLLTRAVSFGALNAYVFYLFEFRFRKLYVAKARWDHLVWRTLELLVGAVATFLLFNYFWNWTEWHLPAFWLMLREYVAVMIFPVAIITFLSTQRVEATSPQPDSQGQLRAKLLTFASDNSKELLRLHPDDLLYVQSSANYVELFYRSGEEVKKCLLRNSLKRIAEEYQHTPYLVRCHRRYLVNTEQIQQVLTLRGKTTIDLGGILLPVSTTYQDHFNQ